MSRKCPFPEKECVNRYMSEHKGYLCCRLDEWKKKIGTCPYDKTIHSIPHKIRKKIQNKEQTKLTLLSES